MSPLETLQEACYRVSDYIIENVKEGNKISESSLYHNLQRLIAQLEKMGKLKKDLDNNK